MEKKGRVFSGIRPTGRAHLGNYLGAFKNYVSLQDEYECVYCIVDLHALTTVEDTLNLKQNTYDLALDLLAVGIRPQETILFVQSHVPQVTELHTLLSMVTPLGKLTDLPTFKEKVRQNPNNVNYGLVGYPVLSHSREADSKFVPDRRIVHRHGEDWDCGVGRVDGGDLCQCLTCQTIHRHHPADADCRGRGGGGGVPAARGVDALVATVPVGGGRGRGRVFCDGAH